MKYTKKEILAIIKSNHRQRIQIEKGIPSEEEINSELIIQDWIDEMELLDWQELSEFYAKYFQIEKYESELRENMKPITKKTLNDLCGFLSQKAVKPKIKPVKLFGRTCQKAAMFKYLKNKLTQENIKAQEIKPSSKLRDYMEDFSFKMVLEINRINPTVLPDLIYEPNELAKQLWKPIIGGFVILIIASIGEDNWFLGGIGIGLLISGYWLEKISNKIPASKFGFEGIETFRDLIEKINGNLNTTSNKA